MSRDDFKRDERESETAAAAAIRFTLEQLDAVRAQARRHKADLATFRAMLAERVYAMSEPATLFRDEPAPSGQAEDVSC